MSVAVIVIIATFFFLIKVDLKAYCHSRGFREPGESQKPLGRSEKRSHKNSEE